MRKVVNVSSISGTGGNIGQSGYAAGKAGVIGLTKTLAKEWGRSQVTVNAVAFGLIKTRLTEAAGRRRRQHPHRRPRHPGRHRRGPARGDGVAGSRWGVPGRRRTRPTRCTCFCIPESDYITGQVVVAGGGLVL